MKNRKQFTFYTKADDPDLAAATKSKHGGIYFNGNGAFIIHANKIGGYRANQFPVKENEKYRAEACPLLATFSLTLEEFCRKL